VSDPFSDLAALQASHSTVFSVEYISKKRQTQTARGFADVYGYDAYSTSDAYGAHSTSNAFVIYWGDHGCSSAPVSDGLGNCGKDPDKRRWRRYWLDYFSPREAPRSAFSRRRVNHQLPKSIMRPCRPSQCEVRKAPISPQMRALKQQIKWLATADRRF
jgi:hypothetical protein